MKRYLLIAGMTLLLAVWIHPAAADTVPLGVLSYDTYFNVGTGATVGAFNVANFVGDPALSGFALPPNFNVFTFLNINNATLTLTGLSAPSLPISIGSIGPGYLLDSSGNPLSILQFSLGSAFTSALLQGTLSATTLTLADGTTVNVDPTISILLTPSSGSNLTPGVDLVVIDATTAATSVPEPGAFSLFLSGLLAVLLARNFPFRGVFLRGIWG
jgi:hypothetical protein